MYAFPGGKGTGTGRINREVVRMGRTARGRTGRRRFRGWYKGLPFLVLPFALFFTETYLHTQRLNNDYEINAINDELLRLGKSIEALEAEKASLENLKLMEARAAQMQFVEPEPNQIETVRVERRVADDADYASLDEPVLAPVPLPQ
jgi:hypothetical protein